MSTFFSGQKVACARPQYPENEGMIGTFISYVEPESSANGGIVDCAVDWHGAWEWDWADSRSLEPFIPDGGASELSYTELMDRLKAGEVECV